MTNGSTTSPKIRVLYSAQESRVLERRKAWATGLVMSSVTGGASGVLGLVLNGAFLIGFLENRGVASFLAMGLLIAAFPLLFLSAHCMDRIDHIDRAIKLEKCLREGFNAHSSTEDEVEL